MSADSGSSPGESALDFTERADAVLEACLECFLPHAPVDDPARLIDFLPAEEPSLGEFLLVELVKLDMAAAAREGIEPCLDRYLDALPKLLSSGEAPLDLVIEEYQLRREGGHEPRRAEYAERFPQHAELLARFSCDAETVAAKRAREAPEGLAPGELIGDFEVVRTLGRGAFAHVYLATQVSMRRLVALKVSAGHGDEPQALAQLDHPNIVRVFDQRSVHGGQTHLLYMQYVPGGTLADVVKRVRSVAHGDRSGAVVLDSIDACLLAAAHPTPDSSMTRDWLASARWPVVVAWVGVQLARALAAAHRRGVLHRDVKPANVLLSADGVPKLADFNVSFAGAAGRAGAAATLGGSIGYMAPEHLRAIAGEQGTSPTDVDERSDIYSLAVLLWELWQGKRPFATEGEARSWTMALAQQSASRETPLVEPLRGRDGGERVLERALRETLDRDPSKRPVSATEFAGRLTLAMHPEAAELFQPPRGSWRRWALAVPPLLLLGSAILLPNVGAGVFNYLYNEREIIQKYPDMQVGFQRLSMAVNGSAFPLGGALVLWFGLPIARGLWRAAREEEATPPTLDCLFMLSHRAAVIGGAMWGASSLAFPIVLRSWFPEFALEDAVHFCASLLVCGGIASVYPFFLVTVLATAVYYPRLVGVAMSDAEFDRRGYRLRRDCAGYLMAAALIPLLAISLLVSREAMELDVLRYAIAATLVGLVASFTAYRYVLGVWGALQPVLSPRGGRPTAALTELS
jgi:hypothetical protein